MIGPTNARGGGSGLNLKVVGGATQPTAPRENTIWVNTTTAITGYALSPTQPENGTEGLVWIKTADTGVEISVGKKNAVLLLHLAMSQVYSGGVWKPIEGYVYASGMWTQIDNSTYLVRNGVLEAQFSSTKNFEVIQATGYVLFKGKTTGQFAAWVDDVDLTKRSTISLVGTFTTTGDDGKYYLAIWEKSISSKTYSNAIAKVSYKDKSTAVLDVTSYTGAYAVGLTSTYSREQKVTSLKIE